VSGTARALTATLLIEVPVVAFGFPRQRKRLVLIALVANTFTNLTLNLVLPSIQAIRGHHVLVGEALALMVETLAYAIAAGPGMVARALIVSGLANALSYELGGVVAALL
jgi:hypothetical protein